MPSQKSDGEIWNNIKENQEQALSELFLRYSDLLLSYSYTISKDRELIKDCIQELFMDIWKRRNKLAEVEKVRSYLLSAIRRLLLRRIKEDGKKLRIEHSAISTFTESEETRTIDKESEEIQKKYLIEKINLLPERQKEVIYLRYYLGMSHEEISQIMQIKKQATWNLLSRAVKKLRLIVKDPRTAMILLYTITLP